MEDKVAQRYRNALRDLTFNSKPIINNLTMLAGENTAHASSIVQVLINHLLAAPAQLKLPALYLIDSICKNVGGPFIGLLSDELVSAFSRSFQGLKDPKLEHEFIRVLKTWRGLFPEPIVRELERRHVTSVVAPPGNKPTKRPHEDLRASIVPLNPALLPVLADLQTTVSQPPHLYDASRVASIFVHLGGTDIDPELLRELDMKARIPDKRPLIDAISRVMMQSRIPTPVTTKPVVAPPPVSMPFLDPAVLAALSPALSMISTSASSAPSASSTSSQISVLATNEEIAVSRPNLYRMLYQERPLQCTTCGLRYLDSAEGREKMAVHLDFHFKRNMRIKDITKKIMTRDWFAPEDEWILGTEKAPSNKIVSVFEETEKTDEEAPVEEVKLAIGPDHTSKVCAVCQESMELVWDDDSEEWILRNAIKIDGQDDNSENEEEEVRVCKLCKRPFEATSNAVVGSDYFKALGTMLTREHVETAEEKWCAKNLSETSFNQGYYHRFFKEGRQLGRGARGFVFLCQHLIDNVPLGEYAVKIVPIGDDKGWLLRHLKEVHILERLRHPNIIDYKHTWIEYHRTSKFGPTVPCLFILMELANGGNLEDIINLEVTTTEDEERVSSRKEKRRRAAGRPVERAYLEETQVLKIFLETAKGLSHLHSLEILHRDLKPANLLLNYPRDNATQPTVLLSDFGECTEFHHEALARTGATGTIEFMAPELFQTDEKGQFMHDHSRTTDIWSLGMILYYLYFGGQLPYKNIDDVEALKAEMRGLMQIKIPSGLREVSVPMRQLLTHILDLDWNKRPALKDIIKAVEAMLAIRKSPKIPSAFTTPPLPAIASHPYRPSRSSYYFNQAHLYIISWILLSVQFINCYPCLPSIHVLIVTFITLLASRYQESVLVAVSMLIANISLLFYFFKIKSCAC